MSMYRIGVDIGGTFTDLVMIDEKGNITNVKVPSTPPNFERGVMDAIKKLEIRLQDVTSFGHGTTIGTNAIINKNGAKVGLVTTKGFRDVLEIRRAIRGNVYDYWWDAPEPLVPRTRRLQVTERMNYAGKILKSLDTKEAREVVATFKEMGVEAIAISFMNSYANGENEEKMKSLVREEHPGVFCCSSSEVLPEILEYERTSTAVINAYLGPVTKRYLTSLDSLLKAAGYEGSVLIGSLAGGMMPIEPAMERPVLTVQSGPASGVVAARFIGELADFTNLITLDMGGTSTDVALIDQGKIAYTNEFYPDQDVPVKSYAVDITSIGAGGGTIAWVTNGQLKSGPKSQGAFPGPACYGLGGEEPTTTDAYLLLGMFDPAMFLGGQRKLEVSRSEKAFAKLAKELNMDLVSVAHGMIRITENNMLNAMMLASVRKGYDSREFAVFAFGGSGPMHAVRLAKELGSTRVMVPPNPGLISALGFLMSDVRHDLIRSICVLQEDADELKIQGIYAEMENEGIQRLKNEGTKEGDIVLVRQADVCYNGQSTYLTVDLSSNPEGRSLLKLIVDKFTQEHSKQYGYLMPPDGYPVEIVNLRVTALGRLVKPRLKKYATGRTDSSDAIKSARKVFFEESGGFAETQIYDRFRLAPGNNIKGPAILEQVDTTIVIPPGFLAKVDPYMNVLVESEVAQE